MHNKKQVVFLDETWANSPDGKDLAWVEKDTVTGYLKWSETSKEPVCFLGQEVRWGGFPIPLSSFAPRKTWVTTMTGPL